MNWEEIRAEYETTEITLADLADKHGIKYPTIKSRKQRQGWSKDASLPPSDASAEKDASKTEKRRGPPKGSRNAAGHGAPKGNKNAVGNRGGPGGPLKNDHAVTHGFFRKYLPEETAEIMEQLESRDPIDILWDNIVIQYTAIIRAQRIMFVRDQDDETKVLKKEKPGLYGTEEEWEYQHAWDKHATFLSAQSRAMTTLQSMIAKYEELCRQSQVDEERELRVKKMKLELAEMSGENDDDPHEQGKSYEEALNAQAAAVFADEVSDNEEA